MNKNNIPVYSISCIFRDTQLFFKPYAKWYKKILFGINHFFVQDEASKQLLQTIGISNISITGDTRFDRVFEIASKAKDIAKLGEFKNFQQVFIAGSTWAEDEEIIIKYINKSDSNLKFIIVPHEVGKTNIQRIEKMLEKKYIKFTECKNQDISTFKVLIIDTIGTLSSAYKYGDIAYVGGGFRTGLHNVLEPATFGIPVLCGPQYDKFKEARELIETGGLLSVNSFDQFKKHVDKLLYDSKLKDTIGGICRTYVETNKGATEKILSSILK